MSTATIARQIASVPVRTSSATWKAIVDLIAAPGSAAATKLLSIGGLAGMVIADEATTVAPIVVSPATGPRVRVYTVHSEGAIDTEGLETPLSAYPTTEPGWTLSLPCPASDLKFAENATAQLPEILVRDMSDGLLTEERVRRDLAPIDAETSWMDAE
jgi:hypothetical protein